MDEYDSLHRLILTAVFNANKNIVYSSNNIKNSFEICKKVLRLINIIPIEINNDLKEIIFINGSKLEFR